MKISKSIRLNCYINQAEIKAIECGVNRLTIRNVNNKNIILYTDSQSALESINRGYINSVTMKDCILWLNELAK